jgi:hypothetical protein
MNKIFSFALIWLISLSAHSTSFPSVDLLDLVKKSDHIFLATVVKVDMVNEHGEAVIDRKAMTGPGLENEIRFHLEIKETLFSKSTTPPNKVIVRLMKAWHYQLGDIQDAVTGNTSIFLLRGSEYDPAYPSNFQRSIEEKDEILSLVNKFLINH